MFWLDPFLLLGCGLGTALLAKHVFYKERFVDQVFVPGATVLVMIVFWGVAIGMFCNLQMPIANLFYRTCGAQTGTEFMVNGGLFHAVKPGATLKDLSNGLMFWCIFMFVIYPLWFWVGLVLGRLLVGRNPRQTGLLGLRKALDADSFKIQNLK